MQPHSPVSENLSPVVMAKAPACYCWGFFAVVMVMAVVLLCFDLSGRGLWSSHEARAGQIARNMIRHDDYVIKRMDIGDISHQKPPLYYWAIVALARVSGKVNETTIRLPSVLSAIALVALVFWVGTLNLSLATGTIAAALLLTFVRFHWLARTGRIDMLLTLLVVSSGLAFFYGYTRVSAKQRTRCYLLGYSTMALALLAKGPVGIILVACGIVVYVVINKDWRELALVATIWSIAAIAVLSAVLFSFWLGILFPALALLLLAVCNRQYAKSLVSSPHLSGIIVLMALALPWFILVHYRSNGEFTTVFFLQHNLARFLARGFGSFSGYKHRPLWFYLPHILVALFPWTLALPLALYKAIDRKERHYKEPARNKLVSWFSNFVSWQGATNAHSLSPVIEERRGQRAKGQTKWVSYFLPAPKLRSFLLVWSLSILLFLSCSSFKRADYLLPLLPLLALLIAIWFSHYYDPQQPGSRVIIWGTFAAFILVAIVGLTILLIAISGHSLTAILERVAATSWYQRRFNNTDTSMAINFIVFFENPKQVILLALLFTSVAVGLLINLRQRFHLPVFVTAIVILTELCFLGFHARLEPYYNSLRQQKTFAVQIKERIGPDGRIILFASELHNLVFYLNHCVTGYLDAYGNRSIAEAMSLSRGKNDYFLMRRSVYRQIKPLLPAYAVIVAENPRDHFKPAVLVYPHSLVQRHP